MVNTLCRKQGEIKSNFPRMRIRAWYWCDEVYVGIHSSLNCKHCHITSFHYGPFSHNIHIFTVYPHYSSFFDVPSGCLLKRGSSKANVFLFFFFLFLFIITFLTLRYHRPQFLGYLHGTTAYSNGRSQLSITQVR